jgi:hypothetical protein
MHLRLNERKPLQVLIRELLAYSKMGVDMTEIATSGRGGEGMNNYNFLEIPESLQEGKSYFLRLNKKGDCIPVLTQVTFFGYTSCPAVVIVQDARKEWLRCSREDLFSFNQGG